MGCYQNHDKQLVAEVEQTGKKRNKQIYSTMFQLTMEKQTRGMKKKIWKLVTKFRI